MKRHIPETADDLHLVRATLTYDELAFVQETEPEDLHLIFRLTIPDMNELFDTAIGAIFNRLFIA